MPIAHQFPLHESPRAVCGEIEHEEQKDPVAQSTSAQSTTSAVDLSDRDKKKNLVVKEEETDDANAFEKVEAEVVKLLKERHHSPPSSLVKSRQ